MKKIMAFFFACLLWGQVALANDEAVSFVKSLADDMITNVLATQKSPEEKLELFRDKFQNALDLKSIGQFVLGVYWKKASDADRTAFLNAFMDFSTKSWADRFNLYTGQTISFIGARQAKSNQVYVDSQVQNNPPVDVIWRVKQTKEGDYKIVDIVVEGVSMAMSYRNEYTAFLQKNNGNLSALTKELETKSAAFKFSEKK